MILSTFRRRSPHWIASIHHHCTLEAALVLRDRAQLFVRLQGQDRPFAVGRRQSQTRRPRSPLGGDPGAGAPCLLARRTDEAEAPVGNGADQPLVFAVVADRLSRGVDAAGQGRLRK